MNKFPMTAAGYSALQDELNQRMAVERPRLIQRMQEAVADDSNLAENSEYHGAQAGQLMNEARIVELEELTKKPALRVVTSCPQVQHVRAPGRPAD
jgi:transcription elongation factor GreA